MTSATNDHDEARLGDAWRVRSLGWLIRTTGLSALVAAALAGLVVPGVQGFASDALVEWCEHASALFAYAMAILATFTILTSLAELVLQRRAESVSGALVVSGAPLVIVLVAVAIARARIVPDAPFPWQLAIAIAIVSSSVASTAAWRASRGAHTRALALTVSAFTLAALLRIGAWEIAHVAGERGSAAMGSLSRAVVTMAVATEAAAQAAAAAWIGSRGRWGAICTSVAAVLAFAVTSGAAWGAHGDAPAWAAALHAALAEPSSLPAPYALSAAQSFLSASAVLLGASALAVRSQPAVLTSGFALALVSRGAFDVPLRAVAIVGAALWAYCAAFDERLRWTAAPATTPASTHRPYR